MAYLQSHVGPGTVGRVINSYRRQLALTDNNSNYSSTSASAGIVITEGSGNLEITGVNMAQGNMITIQYHAASFQATGGNGTFGVRYGGNYYASGMFGNAGPATCACVHSRILASALSSATIQAWMASPNTPATKTIYMHDYTSSGYNSEYYMLVQEIEV